MSNMIEKTLVHYETKIKSLEAKNVELVSKIEVLEFHLNEIATSDLVASNLRCMAKHALNNKNG